MRGDSAERLVVGAACQRQGRAGRAERMRGDSAERLVVGAACQRQGRAAASPVTQSAERPERSEGAIASYLVFAALAEELLDFGDELLG